jgi:Fic family protein
LTETDAQLLFDEGITNGKPIVEYLMNLDLKAAYEYAIAEAHKQTPVTVDFLKHLNALVLKNTGSIYNMPAGTFDSSRGDYRLCGVTAGFGGKSYLNYQKVPAQVDALCDEIQRSGAVTGLQEIYELSFDAHLNLVNIHPWVDGNGRTARLLMNYLQWLKQVVPTKVYREDKAAYIQALEESRANESPAPFRQFMAQQLLKTLQEEIRNHRKSEEKSKAFTLLF